ncbi:ABC transporter ATP-binding protein [Planctomycetes bacterium Poly30]|uniref:ABC transporter ATP-binding protein n=1 Tax=Saltatorellus ferox TaxID=2528018 RepID=A0A518EW96_9BACT|nr:ABC transporter ATP-binding protein [Planctomycetes bacterium Poly30]
MKQPQPGKQPVAELTDVTRTYKMGDEFVKALDTFTFTFNSGEYWAIMGSSGSGKSTLLNLLGCIDRPTSGSYRIRGREVSSMDDDTLSTFRGKELGFIFQSYNLLPQLDVLENILMPVMYQDEYPDGIEERALRLAERVGLGGRLHHKPMQLSGGQQQRVAIARSLINDPALLLADEATGNLDSKTADEILELFDELHDEGTTILLVTHEQDVGERAENILRLKDGLIESVHRGQRGRSGATQAFEASHSSVAPHAGDAEAEVVTFTSSEPGRSDADGGGEA